MARAEELSGGIKSHVEDAERSLTNLVVNTSETIQTGARAAQQALLGVSTDVGAQLKLTSAEVERALTAVGGSAANSILVSGPRRAGDAGVGLVRRRQSGQGARGRHRTLAVGRGNLVDRRFDSSPARARPRPRWSLRPPMPPSQVKSLATDVERTLTAVGTDTAASILNSAREAQTSLTATSADAASQIRAISADLERSLATVTTNTTDRIADHARRPRSRR